MHAAAILRKSQPLRVTGLAGAALLAAVGLALMGRDVAAAPANAAADRSALALLDAQYQRAVEQNDVRTMQRILADDFILIEGDGKRSTKADLIRDAASGRTHYEHQQDTQRSVRLWGDTAVVTAKLWAKGLEDGVPVDYLMWFSDTYVRTRLGWRYVFGQASLPLPKEGAAN